MTAFGDTPPIGLRGARVGKWVARYRKSETNGYITCTLGEADDVIAANGDTILDWKQAVEKARRWIELQERGLEETDPNITVRAAVETYIEKRDARRTARAGRPAHSDAYYTLQRFVLKDPKLAQIALSDLSEADLRAWQKRVEAGKASSLQRVINNLKAALNEAWVAHRQVLPRDLPSTVKYGLKHEAVSAPASSLARNNQILSDEQVRKIISAAIAIDEDGDFARLVMVLAATGARFAQVTRMTVQDVAALHDTSVTMIERHYSRWITEGLDEMAAHVVVPLVPTISKAA